MRKGIVNPFYSVGGIDDPRLFVGRKTAIEEVVSVLCSQSPQCLSIVGQRKIGKTSLLRHAVRREVIRSLGLRSERRVFVYFDCQLLHASLLSGADFYKALLRRLAQVLPNRLRHLVDASKQESAEGPAQLEWVLDQLNDSRSSVIIIFDEFDKAVSARGLVTEGVFGALRGCAQHHRNFAWITSTSIFLHVAFDRRFCSKQGGQGPEAEAGAGAAEEGAAGEGRTRAVQ